MRGAKSHHTWGGILLFLAIAALVDLPAALGLFSAGERPVFDLQLRRMRAAPDPRVVLCCRDERSFREMGDRPPDRAELAVAMENIWSGGASLVVLDILLLSPSGDGEKDARLASALSKVDTILASSPAQGLDPLPLFAEQSVGVGSIDLISDKDGIMRSLPAPYAVKLPEGLAIKRLPVSLAAALAIKYPEGTPQPTSGRRGFMFGDIPFRTTGGAWLIPFCGGDGTLPRISFADALRGGDGLPDLKGKVVLIGSTRASEHDYFSVPIPAAAASEAGFEARSTNSMAGVEVQGQALSALLRGRSLNPLGRGQGAAAIAVAVALALVLTFAPMKPMNSAACWIGGAVVIGAGSVQLMSIGYVIPAFSLGAVWLAHASSSALFKWYKEFEGRRAVERLFGRYISPNIAAKLLENPDMVNLGGRRKTLSILESDIRSFTTMSEQLPPEKVSLLLNEYFTDMTRILFEHDGTLDKFIGDAMLAFFGDPVDLHDHAERAVACAVAMQEEAAALRARAKAAGNPELHIGIAVHTGPVVVGNHGSSSNFDYTVIGDTVNLTARLQGLAKKDDVIVSQATVDLVPGFAEKYSFEVMEPLKVKGKDELVMAVTVAGRKKHSEALA